MGIAKVGLSCGRLYLEVSGIIVAMEGDKCRDSSIPDEYRTPMPESITKDNVLSLGMIRFLYGSEWNEKMLEYVADRINSLSK